MQRVIDEIQKLATEAKNFAEAKIESTKLDTIEKSVNLISALIGWKIITVFATILALLITFVLGLLLTKCVGSIIGGFVILTGSYFIILLCIIFLRERLFTKTIQEKLYGIFLKSYKHENND